MEDLKQVGFDSDGSSVIVDHSSNFHICSEEYIVTDKIEPIIFNGVKNIDVKDPIQKLIVAVIWSWTDDEGNFTKRNLIMYYNF